jgi:hypothetical protein
MRGLTREEAANLDGYDPGDSGPLRALLVSEGSADAQDRQDQGRIGKKLLPQYKRTQLVPRPPDSELRATSPHARSPVRCRARRLG